MLVVAFTVLGAAVLLGGALFVLHLRSGRIGAAPWPVAVLHGLVGIGGLLCLIFALHDSPIRPDDSPIRPDHGTASFGVIGAALIAAAALLGGGIFVTRVANKGRGGSLIGIHATIAISGFVILAAYLFM